MKPFEQRSETKMLDQRGNLERCDKSQVPVSDDRISSSPSQLARERKGHARHRYMSANQQLLYRRGENGVTTYGKVTQFGLRPVEILELFRKLGMYFPWFQIENDVMECPEIEKGL